MMHPGPPGADVAPAGRPQGVTTREVHIKDLIAVVLRHWKLVALLAAFLGGVAYFSGRDAISVYRSMLTVRISSPKNMFPTNDIDVNEIALRTDPILSEVLVLTTQKLALRVTRTLDLQLEMVDPSVHRGDVLHAIQVDSLAPTGEYRLTNGPVPGTVELRVASTDSVLESVALNATLRGPGFSFVVPAPVPEAGLEFRIVSPEEAAAWVSAGISYSVRTETNAVDITFEGSDPTLVPHVLNQVAIHLRNDGAERAREVAAQRLRYIEVQKARADRDLQGKLNELQRFKEGNQITDLTAEEQSIVAAIQGLEQQRQSILIQISTLEDALGTGDTIGVEKLNRLAALEGTTENTAVVFQIENLLKLYEEERSLTAGALGLRASNPQVDAIRQRIRSGQAALQHAVIAQLESLKNNREVLAREIATLRDQLGTFPGKETRVAQLEIERDILHDTYSYLLSEYEQAQMQAATIAAYVNILDAATPPSQIGTDLRQKVMLGFMVGLLLGLAGAFFLEYLDQTIKTAADVERTVGVPVLGLIPYESKLSSGARNGSGKRVVVLSELSPDDPSAEAFRALRTNVTFVAAERPVQFISVTSPGPGEGKSTATVNLAVTLAQGGSRVLLVDADLRRPLVHRAFRLVDQPGLTDILIQRASLREAVRSKILPKLDVLPSGPTPPNPSELLGSEAMQHLISEARREYEYIVIDTPPTLPVTDAAVVASAADATILVFRSGDTEEGAAQRALAQLRRVHARVAGVVLNGVRRRNDQYYSYYSYDRDAGRERSRVQGIASRLRKMF
ncbi:MAG: polysaccharide biosynthesis tyrosine autokinase [Gemmatimonadales bacterium]